ncbi:hypothetical protein FRB96_005787 [Tulasnella sp. 330]|nr:hypothetical protein FRB96_005787 [Tulasnella sp. 330]KAG8872345.1 hypothetical protein FRB97_007714 [Tulasnella sp. 331]KAG8875704.1 hypothetical protein FRB98_007635 [Tulasnella sp. 332]
MFVLSYLTILTIVTSSLAAPLPTTILDRRADRQHCASLTKTAQEAASKVEHTTLHESTEPYTTLSQASMALVKADCAVPEDVKSSLKMAAMKMVQELDSSPAPPHGSIDCRLVKNQYASLVGFADVAREEREPSEEMKHIQAMLASVKRHMDSAGCKV